MNSPASQSRSGNEVWLQPPAALDLPPGHQVDIWRIHLDVPVDLLKILQGQLSSEEAERAARFYFPTDRSRFILSHAILRQILARYLRREPGQLHFSVNEYRKPFLDGGGLEFNLSHSGDFALIAIAQARKVGVDVEQIRTDFETEDIGRRFFSQAEMLELQSLPIEQREAAFFRCWTRKEAYIKAQGMGLTLPLDSFDVSLSPGQPAILRATRPDSAEAARWTLMTLEVGPGYAAALAVEGQSLDFRFWDWK
jgi:4'-phosphopantetheinyl transferase